MAWALVLPIFNIPIFFLAKYMWSCSLQFCEAICPRYMYNKTAGLKMFV